MKILLIIEQCNPEWTSVPLVGYRYYEELTKLAEVTLVTHSRNKNALEKKHAEQAIVYISEGDFISWYYKIAARFSKIGNKTIWPLHHTLVYPIYAEFNWKVYQYFKDAISQGDFDIVHAITPMMPRYPVKVSEICKHTPFFLGPVNGGIPFPPGFRKTAMQEFSYLNFLRLLGRWIIPGYRRTYQEAAQILAGSTYTLNLIQDLFGLDDDRVSLFYENGITNDFLKEDLDISGRDNNDDRLNLLFVGRLVPYKGADMLIEALSQLEPTQRSKLYLRIVGDGSERQYLESLTKTLNLVEQVEFIGWVTQAETRHYYQISDVFCFPSVREFGGAVVLEAMAAGLPCIVVNNGGIGEYVTEATGFRIEPRSRQYVIEQLQQHLTTLIHDPNLRQSMSMHAIQRASEFTWEHKAQVIMDLYRKVLSHAQAGL